MHPATYETPQVCLLLFKLHASRTPPPPQPAGWVRLLSLKVELHLARSQRYCGAVHIFDSVSLS